MISMPASLDTCHLLEHIHEPAETSTLSRVDITLHYIFPGKRVRTQMLHTRDEHVNGGSFPKRTDGGLYIMGLSQDGLQFLIT